jgi:hypothetical protein
MGRLSDLVKKDYELECAVIRDTGKVVPIGIGIAVGIAVLWLVDMLRGSPWKNDDYGIALLAIVFWPLAVRGWERHKVRQEMRHQREVRMEVKLDGLLGIVNITEPAELLTKD